MNDTLGPKGLVPSVLVFGKYPPVFARSEVRKECPTSAQRADVATKARTKMEKQMAELRVKRALHHAVPPAAERAYEPGDKVLV